MLRAAVLAVLLASTAPLAAQTVTIPLNGHNFTLPAGFTIELAAGPPLVDRPVTIAFDEVGHLYVADSSGSNEKLTIQLEKKPHRIVRLDPAVDGVFKTGHVWADKMMFPEGTMWHKGSLYVAAPPSIWKLTDTTGKGVADTRSEWYQGKTLGGCGNDLHGPWLGPDGWFYWTRGGFQPQKHVFAGKEIETRASTLFRAKPDGSGREPIFAGGMDNPVGLAFTPGGEPIVTNTFLVYPANGQRDGLIHAVWGGVYGKDFTDVLAPHIRTSTKLMPVMEHLGPAAPTGIVRYDSDVFGKEYQDNMFVAQFNLRKVSRHILTPKGATFESKTSDFVVSDNHDFHPTDLVMDADGSLLIVDTGGWYKLCCPTSQLVKPDVLGAIYRVRKLGAKEPDDPRGLKIDWENLVTGDLALGDRRPAVRLRAKEGLMKLGANALPVLQACIEAGTPTEQREAVWTLALIGGEQARGLIRAATKSADETVRQAALHCIGLERDPNGFKAAISQLGSPSPQNRRAAAETIGRVRAVPLGGNVRRSESEYLELKRAIDAMADVLAAADPVLAHSLTYAIIESDGRGAVDDLRRHDSPKVRAASVMALAQTQGVLFPGVFDKYLEHDDPDLRATAWWAARRSKIPLVYVEFLQKHGFAKLSSDSREELIRSFAVLSDSAEIGPLLANGVLGPDEQASGALAMMIASKPKRIPEKWKASIANALRRPKIAAEAIAAVRSLRLSESPEFVAQLEQWSADPQASMSIRLSAVAALPSKSRGLTSDLFALARKQLDADQEQSTRSLAVDALTQSKLSADQLIAIADAIPKVGPLELDRLLELFAGQKDDAVGARLMDALEQPKLAASLRVDSLERRLKNFGPAVQERAAKLYARLDAELAGQRAHLEELLTKLPAGDVRRGQLVFNREKSACVACHTIGYVGGKTGPDLTRIGSIRTRRDLLEAIVYPSASFVRGYEPIVVVTNDGKTRNGLIRAENADEVTLTTGVNQEERIARKDIESMTPSRVSVMPAGLEQQLSAGDLADMIAFLQACR